MKKLLDNFTMEPLHRFWVFSDLQQDDPVNARRCMYVGVDDFLSLGIKVDAVCYLGDSTEGTFLDHLRKMADMQVEALARVDAPIYYVMGNHEFDYHRRIEGAAGPTIPMRERILREPQWHTTESVLDWSMTADFGDLALFLLSDRCDPNDLSWVTTHCAQRDIQNAKRGDHNFVADSIAVREKMAKAGKPLFTMSHYSFPGGNRDDEGPLQALLLPLPENVVAHFYGHSHIGDHVWGGRNVFRQISTVNDSAVTQIDVASLENRRGTAVRSAILEWYGGRRFGVFFRNHTAAAWEKCLIEHPRTGIE